MEHFLRLLEPSGWLNQGSLDEGAVDRAVLELTSLCTKRGHRLKLAPRELALSAYLVSDSGQYSLALRFAADTAGHFVSYLKGHQADAPAALRRLLGDGFDRRGGVYMFRLLDYIRLASDALQAARRDVSSLLPVNRKLSGGMVCITGAEMPALAGLVYARRLTKALQQPPKTPLPQLDSAVTRLRGNIEKALPRDVAGSLRADCFPRCIASIIRGVQKGSRNFAIAVVLAPFISRARLCPSMDDKEPKVRDYCKDPRVLYDEIIPTIITAADNSGFADEPGYMRAVWHALGFSSRKDNPPLDMSGLSRWLTPPSCERIKSAGLCPMKEGHCDGSNPLTVYRRAVRQSSAQPARPAQSQT